MPTPLVRSKRSLKPLLTGAPSLAGAAAVVTAAGGAPKLLSPIWQRDQKRHARKAGALGARGVGTGPPPHQL